MLERESIFLYVEYANLQKSIYLLIYAIDTAYLFENNLTRCPLVMLRMSM